MSARETGDLPRCALCGSLNGIIDRQVMLLSITRGPGHRELWSVMACERCAVAVVEKNTGDGAQVHAPLAASTPTTAPPPASPEPAREFVDVVFDGPPSHESGRFVETEDPQGCSFNAGEWIDRKDGYWALRIPLAPKVRVRLPALRSYEANGESTAWKAGYNDARMECAAALRSAGVLIEGEQS